MGHWLYLEGQVFQSQVERKNQAIEVRLSFLLIYFDFDMLANFLLSRPVTVAYWRNERSTSEPCGLSLNHVDKSTGGRKGIKAFYKALFSRTCQCIIIFGLFFHFEPGIKT